MKFLNVLGSLSLVGFCVAIPTNTNESVEDLTSSLTSIDNIKGITISVEPSKISVKFAAQDDNGWYLFDEALSDGILAKLPNSNPCFALDFENFKFDYDTNYSCLRSMLEELKKKFPRDTSESKGFTLQFINCKLTYNIYHCLNRNGNEIIFDEKTTELYEFLEKITPEHVRDVGRYDGILFYNDRERYWTEKRLSNYWHGPRTGVWFIWFRFCFINLSSIISILEDHCKSFKIKPKHYIFRFKNCELSTETLEEFMKSTNTKVELDVITIKSILNPLKVSPTDTDSDPKNITNFCSFDLKPITDKLKDSVIYTGIKFDYFEFNDSSREKLESLIMALKNNSQRYSIKLERFILEFVCCNITIEMLKCLSGIADIHMNFDEMTIDSFRKLFEVVLPVLDQNDTSKISDIFKQHKENVDSKKIYTGIELTNFNFKDKDLYIKPINDLLNHISRNNSVKLNRYFLRFVRCKIGYDDVVSQFLSNDFKVVFQFDDDSISSYSSTISCRQLYDHSHVRYFGEESHIELIEKINSSAVPPTRIWFGGYEFDSNSIGYLNIVLDTLRAKYSIYSAKPKIFTFEFTNFHLTEEVLIYLEETKDILTCTSEWKPRYKTDIVFEDIVVDKNVKSAEISQATAYKHKILKVSTKKTYGNQFPCSIYNDFVLKLRSSAIPYSGVEFENINVYHSLFTSLYVANDYLDQISRLNSVKYESYTYRFVRCLIQSYILESIRPNQRIKLVFEDCIDEENKPIDPLNESNLNVNGTLKE